MKQKIEIEYTEAEFISIMKFCQSMTDGIMSMVQNIAKIDQERRDQCRKENLNSKIESVKSTADENYESIRDALSEMNSSILSIKSQVRDNGRRISVVEHQVDNIQDDDDISPTY